MNLKNEIGNAFNKSSVSYGLAAKIQWEIGQRLIQRLDYLKINPRFILDLGCGPGTFLVHLKKIPKNSGDMTGHSV